MAEGNTGISEQQRQRWSSALRALTLPQSTCSLGDIQTDISVTEQAGRVQVTLALGVPPAPWREQLVPAVKAALASLGDARPVDVVIEKAIRVHRTQGGKAALDQVRNVIAVASGKGGVGKSTTTVNLALALARDGARVGILDADIFGPSLPTMMGLAQGTRPQTRDNRYFIPIEAHGVQTMSMGYLVTEQTPVVWRGPKASGALQQMMQQTLWHDLDYLFVDLPPGTGDIQLTLAQQIPVAGSVIVTTPQDIALLDAIKGIEMFRKVDVPVLGIVENMAMHVCSQCGHQEAVFGEGGGEQIAGRYQTALLGQLPLSLDIRALSDAGTPIVAALPDSVQAQSYLGAARALALQLARQELAQRVAFPRIHTEH